jgi:hypothetical protein
MKNGILCVVLTVMFSSSVVASGVQVWNFDGDPIGTVPQNVSVEVGRWQVVENATAPSKGHVLSQLAESPGSTFNVALMRRTNVQDVDIGVAFRAIGGRIDQGGGPVWRAKDANNYYIARYNPLEDNYRVYKVVKGRRTELGNADIGASPGWHDLRITMIGNHIRGYYDGDKYLDIRDDTFGEPGQVGLWTKADAQTLFDDFSVRVASTPLRWESSFTPRSRTISSH